MSTFDIIILVIGLTSSLTTAIMNLPLAWKVHKTNDTSSLAIMTMWITIGACMLWVIYSFLTIINGAINRPNDSFQWLTAALPVLICNSSIAVIMFYLLFKKIKNDKKLQVSEQASKTA